MQAVESIFSPNLILIAGCGEHLRPADVRLSRLLPHVQHWAPPRLLLHLAAWMQTAGQEPRKIIPHIFIIFG